MSSRLAIEILTVHAIQAIERIQEHAVAEVTQHEKQIDDLKAKVLALQPKEILASWSSEKERRLAFVERTLAEEQAALREIRSALDDAAWGGLLGAPLMWDAIRQLDHLRKTNLKTVEAQTSTIQWLEERIRGYVEKEAGSTEMWTRVEGIVERVKPGGEPSWTDLRDAVDQIHAIIEGLE